MIKEKPNEEEESTSQNDLSMPELTPEEEKTLNDMEQNLKHAIDGMLVLHCVPHLSIHWKPVSKNLHFFRVAYNIIKRFLSINDNIILGYSGW